MPTNDFLPFATGGAANVTAQATYAALAARTNGFSSGVAQADQVNKAIRQASFIAACVAQFTNTNSNQVTLDDGDINGFVAKMLIAWQNVGRIRLIAPLNLYVATTGNDTTNTGLAAGSPFLTLQAAANLLMSRYDLNSQTVTVNVANGTYTQGVSVWGPILGQMASTVRFVGNPGSPGSVVINNGTNEAAFLAYFGAYVSVSGFTITATGSTSVYAPTGYGLVAGQAGQITFDHVIFSTCSTAHLLADTSGTVASSGNPYTISGSAPNHAYSQRNGSISVYGSVITLTGTPAFSAAFAQTSFAYLDFSTCSFSGAATGTRYISSANGVIATAGAGASFLPGSIAGTPVPGAENGGGIYL